MRPQARNLIAFFFLPFVLVYDIAKSQRLPWKKFLYILFVFVFFGSIWWGGYNRVIDPVYAHYFPKKAAPASKFGPPDSKDSWKVPVIGTSMLPTIQTPTTVTLYNPKKYGLERFDIVSLKNNQTDGRYYMKRIIGMPGDHYSIKNGYVTINGQILKEPYVLNELPTYGNSALSDCEDYLVPEHSFVVMGDNRTVSQDSRIIGFVDRADIEGVIKVHLKVSYLSPDEAKNVLVKSVDAKKFVELLNSHRDASRSGTLRLSSKLNGVASKRSVMVRDQFDSWKKLQLPVDQTLEKEGYRFNLSHEYVTFGYLDESALSNQILESVKEKDEFLSGKYLDVGVGTSERVVGSCTYPVISVILGWPSNPDYPKATIDSWKQEMDTTAQNLKYLQSFVGNSSYDQIKIRRYITLEAKMNEISTRLYMRTKNNQWFTDADNRDFDMNEKLIQETNALDRDLFSDTYKN